MSETTAGILRLAARKTEPGLQPARRVAPRKQAEIPQRDDCPVGAHVNESFRMAGCSFLGRLKIVFQNERR